MYRGRVILCLMVLMTVAKTSATNLLSENAVKCSVEVIADTCGSGTISIEFYRDDFVLNYGDVRCWFFDFTREGKLQNSREIVRKKAVEMDLVRHRNNEEEIVGHLTYRSGAENRAPLATLVLKNLEFSGGTPAVYHLRCTK